MIDNIKEGLQNIGVVVPPSLTTGIIPLSHLIEILRAFSSTVSVIAGDNAIEFLEKSGEHINLVMVKTQEGCSKSLFSRIKTNLSMQLQISNNIVKLRRNTDFWIFFFADGLVLPMVTVKMLRKKAIFAFTGSVLNLKTDKLTKDPLARAALLLQNINYKLADKIIIYSESMISDHGLQKYRSKVAIAHEHFLDFQAFRIQKPLCERRNVIGYIGRLREIKGVLNFVESIPNILEIKNDLRFLIGGEGELRNEIEKYLKRHNINDKVKLVGWIQHNQQSNYLNELKLVVLPSYTEGLPNLMLEAMACGTPVLATAVGAIPDIIKDGETGFIMGDNTPECIVRNVIRALNHSDLKGIAETARLFVVRKFNYHVTADEYGNILSGLIKF